MQGNQTYKSEEEIDLVVLFSRLWNTFKKRIKLFLIFLFLGIAAGVAYYSFAKPVYKSRMIISSSVFQGPSFVVIIDNILQLIEEDNEEELSAVLGLDINVVRKIKKLEVYSSKNYAEQEFGDKVTFEEKNEVVVQEEKKKEKKEEFVIVAYVTDKTIFKDLESALIRYLLNSPYIKESSEAKRKGLTDMKENIRKQSNELDSLIRSIGMLVNQKKTGSDLFIGEPGAMFTEIIKLYEAEIRTQEELIASGINTVESFRIYKKPHSPKLILSLAISILLSLFLFLVTLAFVEGKKSESVG